MGIYLSVILPCRNEAATLGHCIERIKQTFAKCRLNGEIIVSDSSDDGSSEIAKKHKVRLVKHGKKGYGIACMEGIKKASGKYIIIGDADGTYDFDEIPLFLEKLNEGYDFVIGSRLKGNIKKNAMPILHRYIGNPALSAILNMFFRTRISDSNSGFRAVSRKALESLELKTTGMEFASEMIIKASKNRLKIIEVPITYYPRIGKSKLNSISDGWRHLRFMLMFSPTYLFFIPGAILFALGIAAMAAMLFGTVLIGGKDIGLYFALFGALSAILGYQILSLGLFSKIYAIHTGFEKNEGIIDFIADKVPLERGITLSLALILAGILSFAHILKQYTGRIYYPGVLFSLVILIIGISTVFSIFFISMMVIEKK